MGFNLQYLEGRDNWQATFKGERSGKYECLMRCNAEGHYYWHQADYEGIPSGATCAYDAGLLAWALAEGHTTLVRGECPALPPLWTN